ncbi:hypothetical protein BDY21DRAFT_417412 [Lineolata rhizophorae]|uniref:Serine-threonine/tyrosine-protein kinase catalytic domain-containing protein n=1 Tax=Lineolata rhizophorae TaxID=578093 RepID=A0A6A6NMT8_9PEZI|nr:hypothetical protein BDY21DRAFT_417412 [Lineolata rhizophorae]
MLSKRPIKRQLTPLKDPILGQGKTGVVVRRGNTALKLPLKHSTAGLSKDHVELFNTYADMSCEALQHEKEVRRRLDRTHGVVACLNLASAGVGIEMDLMANGSLRDYLARHGPDKPTKLAWFREMARTLARIHSLCVIVVDIATRNFLLADDLSLARDNGYSIHTDIGQLGAAMYEVVAGRRCGFDLFENKPPGPAAASWPRRENLPSTRGLWLGPIIDACWTGGAFENAGKLSEALESAESHSQPA